MDGSRLYLSAWVEVGEPDPEEPARECRDCGFDAVLAFPVTILTAAGVTPSPLGPCLVCVRCEVPDGPWPDAE